MKSVFSRMLVLGIAVLFITLAVTSSMLLYMTKNHVRDREEEAAITSAEELGSLLKYRSADNAQLFNRIVFSYAKKLDATVFVCDTKGRVLISSGSISGGLNEHFEIGYQLTEKQFGTVIKGEKVKLYGDFDGYFSKKVVTAGVPLNIDGYIEGGVFVSRAIPDANELMGNMRKHFLISVFISLLLASLIVYITAKRITAPIVTMKKAAKAFASGDFSQRAAIVGGGEIGELAAEFDNMAQSLQNLEMSRQAFVTDISHELRTPMTTISGFVEGILDGTIPEEAHDKYLAIVLDETKRLSRLVNDILYAEKYRRSEINITKEVFDINEVIRLVLIGLERRISEKSINAEVSFEYESAYVLADRDSIMRVITNLIDNAVKFAPDGGTIKVSTEGIGGRCRVVVFNSGSFISESDRTRIFDRFYKTDKSRGIDKSGVGLGLHIVKSILALHGVEITADSNDEGTFFEFSLCQAEEYVN